MTKRIVLRSVFGIAAAALLTLSLGACVSGAKSMKKESGSSMQSSTMNSNDTMKSDNSMKNSSSGNSTMKSTSTMSQ